MKSLFYLFLLFFLCNTLYAANRYWVGGTGSWNTTNTTNWASTSGGAGGVSVPTSADNVFFDALSFTTNYETVTITTAANCLDMNWTGSTTTYLSPTLAGTSALSIYGSLNFIAGMSITYSGDITFRATSTGKTITSAGQTLLGSCIFNGGGGEWTLQDNLTITGTLNEIVVTSGTFLLNTKTLDCYSITVNGGVFGSSGNNSLITTAGSTGITVSSGTFYAGIGTIAMGIGDIIQSGGTFNANTAAISMWDISISAGTYNWNTSTISMYSSGSLTISGTGIVNTNNQTFSLPTINYNGGTFNFGTSAITVTDFKIGGAVTLTTTAGLIVTNYLVNHASGIINLGANTTITGTVTVTLGNFNTANYSLTSSNISVNGGTINLGSSTVSASSTISISSGTANFSSATATTPYLTVSGGSLDLGSSSVNLTGSINNELTLNSSSTITKGTSTITFTGANNTPTVPIHISLGTKAVNNIVFSIGTFPAKFFDGGTINNLTVPINSWLIFENSKTFTLTGDIVNSSNCTNYSIFTSDVIGTASILSLRSGQPALTGIQMRDITNSGASSPLNCTSCVNAGTNSGFNFITPNGGNTLYWRDQAGGNWGDGTSWSTSSNGSSYGCVPTITDNVIFDANSIVASGKSISISKRATASSINCTALGSWNLAITNSTNNDMVICGDLILSSNFGTITNTAGAVYLLGASNQKITCAGETLSKGVTYFANKPTSTVYLEDDGYFGTVNILSGTLNVINFAETVVSNLFFSGDWYRTGTFTPQNNASKYVIFNGSSDGHIYDATTFYNLKIASSAYDLITSADVTINNELLVAGGTYKNTNSKTTLVSGSVNITSTTSTSYLYVNSGTFSYLNNSTTGFNLANGSVWAWGGIMNIGVAGGQTTTVLNIGDGTGSGDAKFDLWISGTVNVADRVLVKSDGILDMEANTLNIKTNTSDGGTTATAKFQINSGGQFKQSGGTINILGAADNTTPAVLFNSGAVFTASTITGGTVVLQSTATAPFNYDYPVDFGGKTLFNLTVNQPSRTFYQSTNGVVLKGSFTITAGTYNANNMAMSVAKNWTNNGTFTSGSNTVTFKGTNATTQTIAGSSATTFYSLDINNTGTGGITLNMPATVSNSLLLQDGILYASATNTLILNAGSSVNTSGTNGVPGSEISFVAGPIKKIGNTAFTFPTGDIQGSTTVWAPITITAPTLATDAFTAEYKFQSPSTAGYVTWPAPASFGSGLHHVSGLEYWLLAATAGSSTPAVTLNWKDGARSMITDLTDITVAHWNTSTSKWESMCSTNTGAGNTSVGSITSDVAFPNYSPITFGSKTSKNPLPISLLNFNAAYNGKAVDLSWQTASEINNDYFTIERSKDAVNFETIKIHDGSGNSASVISYTDDDHFPLSGVSFYRLKQVDFNGDFSYSEIRSVFISLNDDSNNITAIIYPNPVNADYLIIQLSEPLHEDVMLKITDMLGKTVLCFMIPAEQTNAKVFIPSVIKNGVYQLTFTNAGFVYNYKVVVAR